MKVERWNFQRGENILFYVPDVASPTLTITVRCYTPCEGEKFYTLRELEEGIYYFEIPFNCVGKNILVFSEDNVKKLIVIATVSPNG